MFFAGTTSASRKLVPVLFLLLRTITTAAMSSSPLRLSGKRVLITGAGRGIGRAMARICHAQGAQVAICARTASQLQETVDDLRKSKPPDESCHNNQEAILSYVVDVTQPSQVRDMMSSLATAWNGGLDILINNAGRGQAVKGTLTELEATELADLLQLNVVAVHTVTAAAVPLLSQTTGSQIVNISSRAGKRGYPQMSHYVASKFAVEGLTAAWALELDHHDESNNNKKMMMIRVNSFSPGMVNTASFPKPPGRPGVRTAESVAEALLFLLTTPVTGHYLHVDEFDLVQEQGLPTSRALKPINEPDLANTLSEESSSTRKTT